MSAAEFKSIFSSPIYKFWFSKTLSRSGAKNIEYDSFVHQTRSSQKSFVAKTNVDFILSKELLSKILSPTDASKIFNAVKSSNVYAVDGIEHRTAASGQEQLLFKDLKFSNLNSVVSSLIDGISKDVGIQYTVQAKVEQYVTDNSLDKGHVFGFGNTLLTRTKSEFRQLEKNNPGSFSKAQLDALDSFIDNLVDILEDYDISTSDIQNLDADIFVKYRKTNTNWLIEWQVSENNSASGRTVGDILGKTGAKTLSGVRGVFTGNATEKVLKNFVQQFIDTGIKANGDPKLNLLNINSSPSLKDMLVDTLVSSLSGRPKKSSKEYASSFNLPPIPTVVADTSEITKSIKKQKQELSKLKRRVASAKSKIIASRAGPSVPLLAIINATLAQQIEKNMGKGTSKNILNYRTGRLAESVKVERLSESRAGMITAFYSYMKNPYATFSTGGRQEYPSSRDPKLLISKSIREIAASAVTNKLRSVAL